MHSYFRDVQTFPVETTRFPWKSRDNQAKTAELGLARSVLVCGKVGLLRVRARDSMVFYVVSKFSMNVQYFGQQLCHDLQKKYKVTDFAKKKIHPGLQEITFK